VTDALRTSLAERLTRMRGSGEFPPPLLDIMREEVGVAQETIGIIRPGDWDALRHQEGAEGRSAPYWAIAWPSGVELATRLAGMDLEGKRVLELGCGLAIPSIVAARGGASVTATDGVPDAVVFAAHNMALNDVEGEVELADWREAQDLVDAAPWDLVAAARRIFSLQSEPGDKVSIHRLRSRQV
jgi:2-polyprenyl-3-methyl-5-hydroxy-6-metoxy-1,4-benzoquinol methylase